MNHFPAENEFAPFYKGYISLIPAEASITDYLMQALADNEHFYQTLPADRHDFAYDEGKWTTKEVLGHIIDTERIFAYRALRISRGDTTPLAGFSQDDYVPNGQFGVRSWASLVEEYQHVRRATLSLLQGLQPEARMLMGEASGTPVSARALFYMIGGHEAHHVKILKERYLS